MTMTSEKKAEMIDKIQKLLALGTSPNPHEAELAQRKAAELMAQYAIDFADLRTGKKPEELYIRINVEGSSESERIVKWESFLAGSVAKCFDSAIVNTRTYDLQAGEVRWNIAFMGTKSDLELAIFFFKYLRRTVGRAAEVNCRLVEDQKTFAISMCLVLQERLLELYQRVQDIIPTDCRALVLVKKQEVSEFKAKQFPNLQKGSPIKINGSNAAYNAGKEAGKRVNLNRPIGHDGQARTQIG